jgi:HK97 family phage major capsid protein
MSRLACIASHASLALMLAHGNFHFDPMAPRRPLRRLPPPAPATRLTAFATNSPAHTEANGVIGAAATAGRGLTAEEREANDRRFSRMEEINGIIKERTRFALIALEGGNVTNPTAPPGQREFDSSEGRHAGNPGVKVKLNADQYRDAINQFARTGEVRQFQAFRDQFATVTNATGSGAFLPKDVLNPVTIRRLQNCWRAVLAAYNAQPIETDSLATFSLPVTDDTGVVGEQTSESATSGTEAAPDNTGPLTISPTLYGSKQVWYSNSMVMAQAFDVMGYTLPMLQKRIDKEQESIWTASVISTGSVGKTLAATTAITYAELLDWEHSLLPAYRIDAAFAVADSLYKLLRGLVDDQHRPILDVDPTGTFMGKIHGKPLIVGDYFDAVAANKAVGAFVSAEAVKIVDVMNARLARYVQYPGRPDQVGFEMFQNGDFAFVSKGLKLLKTAIS